KIRSETGLKLLTDYHEPAQAEPVAEVVDVLQVPAFLCRQTDLVAAGARAALKHRRILNVKKGQFLAPWDVSNIVDKVKSAAGGKLPVWITERGTSFGYNALVVDMISFQTIQKMGVPCIFDCTHAVQVPGAAPGGKSTGGRREYVEV